jgi:hypothetical protein
MKFAIGNNTPGAASSIHQLDYVSALVVSGRMFRFNA